LIKNGLKENLGKIFVFLMASIVGISGGNAATEVATVKSIIINVTDMKIFYIKNIFI